MCFEASASSDRSHRAWRERRCRERERLVVLELGARPTVGVVLVRRRRRRSVLGLNVGGVLELGSCRQAVDFDDARIAHVGLYAEGVAHRARHDLQLLLVLIGEGDKHYEEAHEETHEVGESDEPAVAPGMRLSIPRHRSRVLGRKLAGFKPSGKPPPTLPAFRPAPEQARFEPGGASPAGRRAASRAPASGSWSRGSSARRR